MGRLSKYSPFYCDLIIDFMKDGKTLSQFAAEIGVSNTTLTKWCDDYPEFAEAKAVAVTGAQAFFETILNGVASGEATMKQDQPGMLRFLMAARFKDYKKDSDVSLGSVSDLVPWDSVSVSIVRRKEG